MMPLRPCGLLSIQDTADLLLVPSVAVQLSLHSSQTALGRVSSSCCSHAVLVRESSSGALSKTCSGFRSFWGKLVVLLPQSHSLTGCIMTALSAYTTTSFSSEFSCFLVVQPGIVTRLGLSRLPCLSQNQYSFITSAFVAGLPLCMKLKSLFTPCLPSGPHPSWRFSSNLV